jgi:hypothetical protein
MRFLQSRLAYQVKSALRNLLAKAERLVGRPRFRVIRPTAAAVIAEGDQQQNAQKDQSGDAE